MGEEKKPEPVKLFIGMISGRGDLLEEAGRILSRTYGPIDLYSVDLPWDHSRYYEKEMGPSLKRRFLFFEQLISPEDMVKIKLKTSELEQMLSHGAPHPPIEKAAQKVLPFGDFNILVSGGRSQMPPLRGLQHYKVQPEGRRGTENAAEGLKQQPTERRQINLDPGYLDLPKIVLASTKDFSHRVYLGRGIFGEVTLLFRDGEYTSLPYTYPEFMKPVHLELFKKARGLLWKTRGKRAPGRPRGAAIH